MRLGALQENLKRGLGIVSHAVATKGTLPVLSNILIATDGSRLKLAATNLELGVTAYVGAQIEEAGATTLPAKVLQEWIGNLPNDLLTLTLDPRTETTNLRCAGTEANIKGIDADQFPAMPGGAAATPTTPTISLPASVLRDVAQQVAFAAASDDTLRPTISGVLVRLVDTTATFMATNGFRLARKIITLSTSVAEPVEVIVPARTLVEATRTLGDGEDLIEITIMPKGSQIQFHSLSVDIVSRLIDGKFPDLERMLPKQFSTRAVIDRPSLLQAIRQAAVFAASSADTAKLTLEPGGDLEPGQLVLSANAAEVGNNKSEVEGEIVGQPNTIASNVKFLQDALNALNTPHVAMEMIDPESPLVIRPVGEGGVLILVMPMKLK